MSILSMLGTATVGLCINLNTISMADSYWLQPSNKVDYNNTNVSKVAHLVTKDCTTDKDRTIKIYSYVVNNMKYDYKQVNNTHSAIYRYTASQAIERKQGICYDYSILYAALSRANNIPCKIAKGYTEDTDDGYHAWNEVYVNNRWVMLDTTIGDCWAEQKDKMKYFDIREDRKVTGYE